MESKDILLSIGRFEAKIDSLEKSVAKLENCVSKMAETMADNKGGWRLVMMLVSISSILGAAAHKPIELIMEMFK